MDIFNNSELKILQKLKTPAKIQDFLDSIPFNFETHGETCRSPRMVLKHRTAHCFEGAVFAAAALRVHNMPPLAILLHADKKDYDHVIAPFQINKKWGAISKTNHACLRYREPVYRDIHELVMSYFHEYFLDNGRKTLRSFTNPINLSRFDKQGWMSSEKELWYIDKYLDRIPCYNVVSKKEIKNLRQADPVEIKAGKIIQYRKK
ncbi:hypothetical protein D4R52_02485 [bacterium]|nr:MAG: hypothetical protein D4R52_02485 [bacterium]